MWNNHFFQENIILSVGDLITNQKVSYFLKLLQKSKYWDREKIDAFQIKQLKVLIAHAYNYVPYYTDLFNKLNLKPVDIQTKADLFKLPVLTKETIKKEGIQRFTSTVYPIKKQKRRASSGSTGEPLHYISTIENYSFNLAANLRGWYDFGFRLGDKYIKLSQNIRNSKIKKLQDYLSNNKYVSVNPMNDKTFKRVLRIIEEYKPKVIRCYPDFLFFLASFKTKHPEFTYIPQAITTTGNILSANARNIIENAFGCKIFDSYSCEGNANVFECVTHECYHVTEEYGITEILDDNNNSITSGIGRLISTDLWNLAHPFIRYDTQDLVEVDDKPCTCDRSHLRINKILGRDNEILIMPNGKRFVVHNFTSFFTAHIQIKKSVDQFQVIKKKDDTVIIRLIVNSQFDEEVKSYIINFWKTEFETEVVIELVDKMPLMANTKRKFIVNE